MRQADISPYFRRIVSAYLQNRTIQYGSRKQQTTAGVPQGSILGLLLWNAVYNSVLELENLPQGVQTIAYADDFAILVTAKEEQVLENRTNKALRLVDDWMKRNYLTLAPQKSEAILLIGRKKCGDLRIKLEDHQIQLSNEVKYLGVTFDRGLTGSAHIKHGTAKASAVAGKVSRLMPRICGASESKRRLLASVAESVILYAAPIWAPVIKETRNNSCELNEF